MTLMIPEAERETLELKEELFKAVEVVPGGFVRVLYAGEFYSSHQTMNEAQKRIRLVLHENKKQRKREAKMKPRGLVGKEGPRVCEHNVQIDRFECPLCTRADDWPVRYPPDWRPELCGKGVPPDANWSQCDHGIPYKDCTICYPFETVTVRFKCVAGREGCLGEVTETMSLPRGTRPSPNFYCKNCAGKIDKRGRFRKARDRESLCLDNPSYRIDKYRAARKPGGMTETDFKGTIEPKVAPNREVVWLEQNLLAILAAEGIVASPSEMELLKLYQAGRSYKEIADALGFSKANVRVVLNRIAPRIRRRIRTSAQLRRLVSPIFQNGGVTVSESRLDNGSFSIPLGGPKGQPIGTGTDSHGAVRRETFSHADKRNSVVESIAELEPDDLDNEAHEFLWISKEGRSQDE
jgi:DNA-binding CsgD family transcriptional regulator